MPTLKQYEIASETNKIINTMHIGVYDYNAKGLSQHNHSFPEVGYVLSGSGTFYVNENEFSVNAGDLFIIKPNDHHHEIINGNAFEVIFFQLFNNTFLQSLISSVFRESRVFKAYDYSAFSQVIKDIFNEINENHSHSKLMIDLEMTKLLILVERLVYNEYDSKKPLADKLEGVSNYTLIYKVKKYIDDNIFSNISIEDIVKHFFYSHSSLNNLFKKFTGCAIKRYITNAKITKAMELLSQTDRDISLISDILGFNSTSHFCRVFKELTDLTPSQYRKNPVNIALKTSDED